jgi:hypothetical protein
MRTAPLIILSRIFLILVIALGSAKTFAQALENNPDQVYGYDPLLYNGMVYYYYSTPGTGGTQYLFDDFDTKGSLTVRGVKYTDQALNLDVFNQKLILKYKNTVGSSNLIEISFAWLESFEIKGRHFELVATADTTKEIYQVIGAGPSKVLYYQSKKLLIQSFIESTNHAYSKVQKVMYVFNGHEKIRYKNNRSFVNAFNPDQHDMIRKYIRKHNLTVQKAKDSEMTELINYCNSLTGS